MIPIWENHTVAKIEEKIEINFTVVSNNFPDTMSEVAQFSTAGKAFVSLN